ncbi:13257_t:CDS:1 [Ambispora leptoticha]|uniref:13257_t:CDS:1 n=1 Tax=Ambispora leptoticha TaxID=144679 RepID=A0A9N9AKR2_9GLOM|nr:13257_t:CDS:1 [Ambispora leptoticha]
MSSKEKFFLSLVALLLCLSFGSTAPFHHMYYLSLGDSFAAGVKPISPQKAITPSFSYANVLYYLLKRDSRYSNLKLIKYGCSGATSDDLINQDKCNKNQTNYSQLDQAIDFMKSHRGMVKFVTINIGVNDIHRYCDNTGVNDECVSEASENVSNNLNVIISKLKEAGGELVQYAGSTYFHKFTNSLDDLLVKIYSENGFRVADIRTVFDTNGDPSEFSKKVCLYTNSCNKFNNSHPNVQGSEAIGLLYYNEFSRNNAS